MPALPVPQTRVRDTSGAGDVFHGAYVYSYLENPCKGWEEHFRFAQHAAAYKIQHLGNEAGLPTLDDDRGRSRANSIRIADDERPGRRAQASPRCGAAADRTASSSSDTGQRRRQFGCSVTVPGTLT